MGCGCGMFISEAKSFIIKDIAVFKKKIMMLSTNFFMILLFDVNVIGLQLFVAVGLVFLKYEIILASWSASGNIPVSKERLISFRLVY